MPPPSEADTTYAFRSLLDSEFGFTGGEITLSQESIEGNITNQDLIDCLSTASKKGTGKSGRPDLLGYNIQNHSKLIFLIEVKPTKVKHQGPHQEITDIMERSEQHPKDIQDYAVDGIQWYMHHCRERFSVIGLAVSGTKEEIESRSFSISTYYQRQSKSEVDELHHYDIVPLTYNNPSQSPITSLIQLQEYLDAEKYDPQFLVDAEKSIEDTKDELEPIIGHYAVNLERALTLSSLLVALGDETCQGEVGAGEHDDRIELILDAYERQMTSNEPEDAGVVGEEE
jgi:hypothetical protein